MNGHDMFAMTWGTLTVLGVRLSLTSPWFWLLAAPVAVLAGYAGPRLICGLAAKQSRLIAAAAVVAATAVALVLAGCGSAVAPARHHATAGCLPGVCFVSRPAAAAYLLAHPVKPVYGMDEGIVLGEAADASQAVYTWTQTLLTADGRTVTVTCGNVQAADPCTWRSDGPGPGQAQCGPLGDYEYFPADLNASNPASVVVITCGAVRP